MRTEKAVYALGEAIGVHLMDAPAYDSDRICIVPAGAPDTDAGSFTYMARGLSQGILTFDLRPPGTYEARVYCNCRRIGYVPAGPDRLTGAGTEATVADRIAAIEGKGAWYGRTA